MDGALFPIFIAILVIFFIIIAFLMKNLSNLKKSLEVLQLQYAQFYTTPIPLFFTAPNGKVIKYNEQFQKSFGDHTQKAIRLLEKLPFGNEHTVVLPFDNGVEKNCKVHINKQIGHNDRLLGQSGVILDISEHKTTLSTFQEKKSLMENCFKASDMAYFVWDVKSDTIDFSKEAIKLFGYKENIDLPITLKDFIKIIGPYDYEKVADSFVSHSHGETGQIDVKFRLKTFENKRWFHITAKALHLENNRIKNVHGILYDISKYQHTLDDLQKQKDILTIFINALPAMAFMKDKEGKYIYINDFFQKIIGFKEWKHLSVEELFEPEIASKIRESDREALYEGIKKHEEKLKDENGNIQLLDTYKFPIETEDGKLLCGFGFDITKQEVYKNRLELYKEVFDKTSESILITDKKGTIISANKAFCSATGFKTEEVIGKRPNIRKSGQHTQEFYKKIWEDLLTYGKWSGEIFNKNKNGTVLPELLHISSITDTKGNIVNFIGISQSIQEQKNMEMQLRKKANFDPLTNLPSRSLFQDRLEQAIQRSSLMESSVALIFVDLDDFKQINDRYGNNIGDLVLQESAHRFLRCIRQCDTVARLGGDEFVMILENIKQTDVVIKICQKVIDEISRPIYVQDKEYFTGVSLGVALYPNHTKEIDKLLEFADTAIKAAKKSGKNQYRFFESD